MGFFDFPNFKFTNSDFIYIELLFACARTLEPEDVTQWFRQNSIEFSFFVVFVFVLCLGISELTHTIPLFYIKNEFKP